MVYSKFFHRDSRPINGLSDPHWHVHCFVHNATFDPVENRWKAGQFRWLIADKGYFQEYFHTLLAQRLMESGYKLRRRDRGWHQWEMACITDREVELFSKRNELIDTLSEERDRRQRKKGGLRSRSVIARQPSFFSARRRLRTGVSKWDRSGGT
jgi:conjugative relaxase-like TrwC/TraI family protein